MEDTSEKLDAALAELIEKATAAEESTIAWTAEQLPDVIQQLLWWKFAESLLFSLIFVCLVFLVGFVWVRKINPIILEEATFSGKVDTGTYFLGQTLVTTVVVLVMLPFFIVTNLDWLQILIAPKVYLIEYAAKLVQ